MMYYTIAHYLHKDIYGQVKAYLSLNSWTFEVMDYIFLNGAKPPGIYMSNSPGSNCGVKLTDMATINKMRDEFLYWYPLDLRVSGKDLIRNHLAFCLFQHVALVGSEQSPKEFRVNGYIMVDHKKMAKSEGNFITLEQAFDEFGVDSTRFALAYAGDDCNADANFEKSIATTIKGKLDAKKEWTLGVLSRTNFVKINDPATSFFIHRMKMCFKNAKQGYEDGRLKDVCFWAFFELEKYRKQYESFCDHCDLIVLRTYIYHQAIVLSPIIPLFSKWICDQFTEETRCVQEPHCAQEPQSALFPTDLDYDQNIITEANFYNNVWKEINQNLKENTKTIEITFVKHYPNWVQEINDIITKNSESKMKDIAQALDKHDVDKIDRRSIMATVKSGGGIIATENSIDLTNADVMLTIMAAKLKIKIQHVILDQHKQIIPTKPQIICQK
jgi:leucyl-tRNA synthetase